MVRALINPAPRIVLATLPSALPQAKSISRLDKWFFQGSQDFFQTYKGKPIGTTEFRGFWKQRLRDSKNSLEVWLDSTGGFPQFERKQSNDQQIKETTASKFLTMRKRPFFAKEGRWQVRMYHWRPSRTGPETSCDGRDLAGPNSFSITVFEDLRRRGYVIVNSNTVKVQRRRGFARLQDIQPPVEAALLMTSPEVTDTVVSDCAEAASGGSGCTGQPGGARSALKQYSFANSEGFRSSGAVSAHVSARCGAGHRIHGFIRKIGGRYPRRGQASHTDAA